MFSKPVERAIAIAAIRHKDQVRKGSRVPFITHPVHVATMIARHGLGDDALVIALLHDVVEDTCDSKADRRALIAELSSEFGATVAEAIDALSEPKHDDDGAVLPWRMRKEAYLAQLARAAHRPASRPSTRRTTSRPSSSSWRRWGRSGVAFDRARTRASGFTRPSSEPSQRGSNIRDRARSRGRRAPPRIASAALINLERLPRARRRRPRSRATTPSADTARRTVDAVQASMSAMRKRVGPTDATTVPFSINALRRTPRLRSEPPRIRRTVSKTRHEGRASCRRRIGERRVAADEDECEARSVSPSRASYTV